MRETRGGAVLGRGGGFLAGKLRSFLDKGPRDQARAVAATIRQTSRTGLQQIRERRFLAALHRSMVLPRVLRSRNRHYLACRPDSDVDFDRHPELQGLAEKFVANNRANNSGDLPRLYALALNVKQVLADGVAGDFAELGVYRGNSAAMLAHYARQHDRTVFLFDTYDGFDAKDLIGIDAFRSREFADTSLPAVRETVGEGSAVYVKGYFPDSVTDEAAGRRYAIVHLDCDLYEPIRAGLAFFFDRLSPGGLLIVHDYSNPCWEGAKRAVDEYVSGIPESLVLIPDKSGTAMLRKSR